MVLGGDDATWIDTGTDAMGFSVRQLSGFHLARSCRRGWKNGKEIYDAIRNGVTLIGNGTGDSDEQAGETAEKSRYDVLNRLKKGIDWRLKVADSELASEIPEDVMDNVMDNARGLGAIEGNESNLFADRMKDKALGQSLSKEMKDRGMSWTIKGAQHMGKAIQLVANEELDKWCGARPSEVREQKEGLSFDLVESQSGSHARGQLPALIGPHAARHWITVLRNMTVNTHRLL